MSNAVISTAASACAPFCTEEEVEALKRNGCFSVGRRLRAAYDNSIYILPRRPGSYSPENSYGEALFLGTAWGLPVFRLQMGSGGKIELGRCHSFSFDHVEEFSTVNPGYLITKARKLKTKDLVTSLDMNLLYRLKSFELMRAWIKKMIDIKDVAVNETMILPPALQHKLVEFYAGNICKEDFGPLQNEELMKFFEKLQRSDQFMHGALDHAKAMFGREKWMVFDMGNYIIAAGIDMSELCRVAQNAISEKKDPNRMYLPEGNFSIHYTHAPTVYRSLDEAPRSLLSSLTFVRSTIPASRLAGMETPHPIMTVMGLPSPYHSVEEFFVDAGWCYKARGDAVSGRVFGQSIVMDKD